jgi:hypothetical protein
MRKFLILLIVGAVFLGLGLRKLYAQECNTSDGNTDGTEQSCQEDPSGDELCQAQHQTNVCESDTCNPPCYDPNSAGGIVTACVASWNLCGDVYFPCRGVTCTRPQP